MFMKMYDEKRKKKDAETNKSKSIQNKSSVTIKYEICGTVSPKNLFRAIARKHITTNDIPPATQWNILRNGEFTICKMHLVNNKRCNLSFP